MAIFQLLNSTEIFTDTLDQVKSWPEEGLRSENIVAL